MNPRVSRSSRAGLQGHRLPDRQDRRAAGGRLHARRDPQRHHAAHARLVRAGARLRGRQVAALRVREVPRRRRDALDPHEVGRRGDGDRPHVPAGVRARRCARASSTRRRRWRADRGAARRARDARRRPLRRRSSSCSAAASPTRRSARARHRPLVPARAARCSRPTAFEGERTVPTAPSTPARPSSRPRRRTTTPRWERSAAHEVAPRRQARA